VFCWIRIAGGSFVLLPAPGLYALGGWLIFFRITGDRFDWRLPAFFAVVFYLVGLGEAAVLDPSVRQFLLRFGRRQRS
jgi:hypothetical protein